MVDSTKTGNFLSLSAFVNGEWAYAINATFYVSIQYSDGEVAGGEFEAPIGEMDYVRVCKSWKLSKPNLHSVTVFVVARPVSQNFGTLFVDDMSLELVESEPTAECETVMLMPQPGELLSGVETGPEPSDWSSGALKSKMCTVALVHGRDSDYVATLSQQHTWPLVVVLLASNGDTKSEFGRFEDLVDRQKGQLVVASSVQEHFPQNALRALGQSHCPKLTTHVLHLDSGMVPSSSLFRLNEGALKSDEVVIVPAFELDVPEMKLPQIEDKESLKKVIIVILKRRVQTVS